MTDSKSSLRTLTNRYEYKGDVLHFGRVVHRNWNAVTYAANSKKAASNLKYRYKKENGLAPYANITLDASPHLASK